MIKEVFVGIGYIIVGWLAFSLIIGVIFAPFIGIERYSDYQKCERIEVLNPERNVDWSIFGGCMVQADSGLYLPLYQFQSNDVIIKER
jgi:hypothetical protein